MKKLFVILPLVLVLCFVCGCEKVDDDVTAEVGVKALSAEDVAAIKSLAIPFDKAALGGDWNTLVASFTEDVVLMSPNGPSIQGHSAFKEMLESLGLTITEHKIEFVEVDGYGDIAYAKGTYVETYSIEGVEEPIKDKGKILTILRKQADGTWLFAIWMNNSNLPLPE